MISHALFASLNVAQATPVTDDPLHRDALQYKLRKAAQDPSVSSTVNSDWLRSSALAYAFLSERKLELPALQPSMPIEEVLRLRDEFPDAFSRARNELYWMARRIRSEPFTAAFADDLDHSTIPKLRDALEDARRARDAWLRSAKANRLKTAAFTASTAGALIGLFAAPVAITIALAAGVLALAGGVAKDLPDVIDAFRQTQPDLSPMTFFLMEPSGS